MAVYLDGPGLEVNMVQEVSLLQLKSGVLPDDLPLRLELDDGDGLVHLHLHLLLPGCGAASSLQGKAGAGVVPVGVHGKEARGSRLMP